MLQSIILFLSVIFVSYLIVHRWKHQRFYELAQKLPGHEGLSLYRSMKYILTTHRKDYISIFKSFNKDDEPITKIWIVNYFLILTKNPEIAHKVFNMPQTYNKPYTFYQAFMIKNGLLTLNGEDHRRHRRILSKAFSPKMLQRLPKIFDEKSKKILQKMEKELNRGTFDVVDYAGAFALDALSQSNFNNDLDCYNTKLYQIHNHFTEDTIEALPLLIAGINRKMLSWTRIGRRIDEKIDVFRGYLKQIAKKNHEMPEIGENTIINLLLDKQNKFSDEEIIDEFMIMSIGGFETSARTSSIALMMLGIHKEIQQHLIEEIDQIFNSEADTSYTLEFLHKFTYLEAVIKETLRLYPIASMIIREVTEEVDVNGFLIPKGALFLVLLDAMHRDEKYWGHDAHLFRPERFTKELKNPLAFAPFTGGRRICIGYRYAMISMKIFLINFLRTYKVDCPLKFDEIQTEITMTLNIVNGYKISISRR